MQTDGGCPHRLVCRCYGRIAGHQQRRAHSRERSGVGSFGQNDGRAGFAAHIGKARHRERRIQWQVRTARLQDREQAADRLGAALKARADQGLGADAHFLELAGQLIDGVIQLAICQPSGRGYDRVGVGLAGRARTEKFVDKSRRMPQRVPADEPATVRRRVRVCRFRAAGADALRGNVPPGSGDGRPACAYGHRSRLPPPAGRQRPFRWPHRMLALVIDDDRKGIFFACPRCRWICRDMRFVPIDHFRQFCLCAGHQLPAVRAPVPFRRCGRLSFIGYLVPVVPWTDTLLRSMNAKTRRAI
jgi:hypothetical protein